MKVSYKEDGGSGYTVLADEGVGDNILTDFAPSFRGALQETPVSGGEEKFREPRGNVECSLALPFNKEYASRAAALASIHTLAALQDTLLHLKVEEGAHVQYYPNAVVSGYDPKLCGVSVQHVLQFKTDNVTTTAP